MKPRYLLVSAAIVAIGAGSAFAAYAQPHRERGERHEKQRGERRIEMSRIDANSDKFVTRAEAQAEAERVFAQMDDNADGKLDATDRGRHGGRAMHRVEIRDGARVETSEDVIIERNEAPRAGGEEREVIIQRDVRKDGGDRRDRHRAHGRGPNGPPMFMMIIANSEEADRNGDNALSKEEFVSQQLRFFDAADANGDGKIKFDPPPLTEPPEAPKAPAPPAPPPPPRR